MMDPQLILVLLIVIAASAYLGRTTWRSWSGKKAGCGDCGCHSKSADQTDGQATIIPADQLSLRARQSK